MNMKELEKKVIDLEESELVSSISILIKKIPEMLSSVDDLSSKLRGIQ